ncbi:FAD dependent oxidoreductase-domain-containing protein [Pelagophyceae sp. CCMP2097]|nr:FAD dependent oxidoreductase-domain-containing protein [Pelagophyceae sp. CCMP2097]KAJ1450980.1 FAD dependent oxidoreductase-domain-containing protein [Pelagophyceae sp. CCMP2097]
MVVRGRSMLASASRAWRLTARRPALATQRWLCAAPSNAPSKPGRLTRVEQLSHLSSTKFDLLVVGGGVTGSGVALDASLRGLRVALVERADFSSETSSRSTKLIWAGVKYMATAVAQLLRPQSLRNPRQAVRDFASEMQLVRTAHRERTFLLETQPHLTSWLPIAVPVKAWLTWPPPFGHALFAAAPLVLPFVFKLYDALGGFRCPPSHVMSPSRAMRKFPQLACKDHDDLKYAAVFYEGVHNDSRTALCLALTASDCGATVCNYTEMKSLVFKGEEAVGAIVWDAVGKQEVRVDAKHVVFAGGPFTDELRTVEFDGSSDTGAAATGAAAKFVPAVKGAAGTHIVLPGYFLPPEFGMLDINTSDGRFLFLIPWLGSVLIGTTDRPGVPTSSPRPPEIEIEWLLKEAQKYLSTEFELRRSDVTSAWCGWRPLASDPNASEGAPVSRDHIISTNPKTGVTFVTGGKWTTYREMAEETVDAVIARRSDATFEKCTTLKRVLSGGTGYTANLHVQLLQRCALIDAKVAKHLAATYGVDAYHVLALAAQSPTGFRRLHAAHPYIEGEIAYACAHEYSVTVADAVSLRCRLAYLDKNAATESAPRVADLMASALGWPAEERDRQLRHAVRALSHFGGPEPHVGGAPRSAAA